MLPPRLLKSFASSVLADYLPAVRDALARYDRHSSTFVQDGVVMHNLAKRSDLSKPERIAFGILIPVLVILSGIFAGLTLGYMSLDETQLSVLSTSGSPKQREYAKKIMPIRKNGHLLLVTLLLANMIVNETLPVIADPLLGGGVEAVAVSTVLIVLFAEIIPQSVCTRHGLLIGAKMAGITQLLIYAFAIVAWPVAKFLEFVLGPHHGIMYRRGELKELIALHGASNPTGLGGDLRHDTVTIIGATLDLQDKTVRHAMTPIDRVFMLHIDSRLDYDTLRRICATGHSRIPVYEEVEVDVTPEIAIAAHELGSGDDNLSRDELKTKMMKNPNVTVKTKVKKIVGILLVKQCVLLDPEDAVPVRRMHLNKVPFVPQNEPLLGILDRFQEGRSHLAIVSRISKEKAQSVKKEAQKNLTQRLLGAFHSDSSSESSDSSDDEDGTTPVDDEDGEGTGEKVTVAAAHEDEGKSGRRKGKKKRRHRFRRASKENDLEKGDRNAEEDREKKDVKEVRNYALEQRMPADALLSKKNAEEYLASQAIDPAIMPLGIITLEDVLEELIGEEIYDEFDVEGEGAHQESFLPPGAYPHQQRKRQPLERKNSAPELSPSKETSAMKVPNPPKSASPQASAQRALGLVVPRPTALPNLRNLNFLRSRSAPPTPRSPGKPIAGVPSNAASTFADGSSTSPVHTSMNNSLTPVPTITDSSLTATAHPSISDGDEYALSKIAEGVPTDRSPASDVPKELFASAPEVTGVQTSTAPRALAPLDIPTPKANTPSPPTILGFALTGPTQSKSGTPRSGSPAPSLEAVLLERKRRGQSFSGPPAVPMAVGLATGASSTSTSSGVMDPQRGRTKGGFKSSPLSPLAADTNVIIADDIRKQRERAREKETKEKDEGGSNG